MQECKNEQDDDDFYVELLQKEAVGSALLSRHLSPKGAGASQTRQCRRLPRTHYPVGNQVE